MTDTNLFDEATTYDQARARIVDYLLYGKDAGRGIDGIATLLAEVVMFSVSRHDRLAAEIRHLSAEIDRIKARMQDVQVIQTKAKIVEALDYLRDTLDFPAINDLDVPDRVVRAASELWEPADGFYELEWTPEGLPYRWAGPERTFRFAFTIERATPLTVTLEVLNKYADFEITSMKCRVDGQPTRIQVKSQAGSISLLASIPPRRGYNDLEIEFEVPELKRAVAPDQRMLSLALKAIRVEPAVLADVTSTDVVARMR